jgi:MFS family permease
VGRKWLIAAGLWVQAAGIAVVAFGSSFLPFSLGAVVLGIGTAMVYPTLLAAIGDVAHPSWRASAVGVYRLWRDLGYAVGALLAGITAYRLGVRPAIVLVAGVTAASGLVVAWRLRETLRSGRDACVEPRSCGASETRARLPWRSMCVRPPSPPEGTSRGR